jgi:hypothetical protein
LAADVSDQSFAADRTAAIQMNVLTSLDLGLMLDAVVGLTTTKEILTAPAGLDVLDAHVDALADDAPVHLSHHV